MSNIKDSRVIVGEQSRCVESGVLEFLLDDGRRATVACDVYPAPVVDAPVVDDAQSADTAPVVADNAPVEIITKTIGEDSDETALGLSGPLPQDFPGVAQLEAAGITTWEKLLDARAEGEGKLPKIDGIGKATEEKIYAAIEVAQNGLSETLEQERAAHEENDAQK